jgi:RNA polymerase sigma factor (TIGR02999 family)
VPEEPADGPADAGKAGTDITRMLERASQGNREAFDQLLPLVYGQLKELARARLRMEADGHTLNATALVHEAYINLVGQDRVEWQSRAHFFAVAAQAMRRILVDHARGRGRAKRGEGAVHVELASVAGSASDLFTDDQMTELLALDQAMERLREFDPQSADVVEFRFFGGLSHQDIAEVQGTSEVTVRRRWRMAKTWLRRELDPDMLRRTGTMLAGRVGD